MLPCKAHKVPARSRDAESSSACLHEQQRVTAAFAVSSFTSAHHHTTDHLRIAPNTPARQIAFTSKYSFLHSLTSLAMPTRIPDESIYNLLPAAAPASSKAALYRSRHPHSTPPTASTFGASIATACLVTNSGGDYDCPAKVHRHVRDFAQFGPKQPHSAEPAAFVAAHTHPELPTPERYAYTDRRKPALDTTAGLSASLPSSFSSSSSSSSQRNFIAENTSRAVALTPPAAPEGPRRYRLKEDYGRVPEYLETVKAAVAEEKEMIASAVRPDADRQQGGQLLADAERCSLLDGLKRRWEELMSQYQVLTHMTSNTLSMGNLKRKEELERKITEVEKAIKKLDKTFVVIMQQNA
jgi:hypothetical protein